MEPRHTAYPTIGQGFGLIGITVLATLIVTLLLQGIDRLLPEHLTKEDTYQAVQSLVLYFLSFVLVIAFARRQQRKEGPAGLQFRKVPAAVLVVAGLMTPFLGILIEPLATLVPMPAELEALLEEYIRKLARPDLIGVLSLVVLPALLEEILFRGIILEGMLRRYRPGVAIFWSALLFGIVHFNPAQFVTGLLIGLFMGWLYWKTRSLWPGILIHAINNALALWTVVTWDAQTATPDLLGRNGYLLLLAGSLIAVALGTWWLHRRLPAAPDSESPKQHDSFTRVP